MISPEGSSVEALNQVEIASKRPLRVREIQREVCAYYGLTLAELTGPRRQKHIVHPRQLAMALARRLTRLSISEIGRRFGGRDHSTVCWALDAVAARCAEDGEQRAVFDEVSRQLTGVTRAEFIRHRTAHPVFSTVRKR